jgi:hypothetical protein
MNHRGNVVVVVVALAAGGGCREAAPSVFQPASSAPSAVGGAPTALVGHWEGSSVVESSWTLPECGAPFWHPGFRESTIADIERSNAAGGMDLFLDEQASEDCHLQVKGFPDGVDAGPWPYDEFDCALVPSLCGLQCHFKLRADDWGCAGIPPEVWITDLRVRGTFTDASRTRLSGTVEVGYAHRPGGSQRGYTGGLVIKRVELAKVPR